MKNDLDDVKGMLPMQWILVGFVSVVSNAFENVHGKAVFNNAS